MAKNKSGSTYKEFADINRTYSKLLEVMKVQRGQNLLSMEELDKEVKREIDIPSYRHLPLVGLVRQYTRSAKMAMLSHNSEIEKYLEYVNELVKFQAENDLFVEGVGEKESYITYIAKVLERLDQKHQELKKENEDRQREIEEWKNENESLRERLPKKSKSRAKIVEADHGEQDEEAAANSPRESPYLEAHDEENDDEDDGTVTSSSDGLEDSDEAEMTTNLDNVPEDQESHDRSHLEEPDKTINKDDLAEAVNSPKPPSRPPIDRSIIDKNALSKVVIVRPRLDIQTAFVNGAIVRLKECGGSAKVTELTKDLCIIFSKTYGYIKRHLDNMIIEEQDLVSYDRITKIVSLKEGVGDEQ